MLASAIRVGCVAAALATWSAVPGRAVAQNGRLHAIVAVDSSSPDIGQDMKANEFWYSLALRDNVPENMLNIVPIDGTKLSQANVLATIRDLDVGADDDAVFYYGGHGFYEPGRGTFIAPKADRGVRLYRATVEQAILAKGPRLCVVIFDCCSVAPKGNLAAFAPGPKPAEAVSPLFDSLFFASRGSVTLISSSPGEYALCHIPIFTEGRAEPSFGAGSLFTGELTSLLHRRSNDRLSWETFCPILRNQVSRKFRMVAKDGAITLSGGGVLTQRNQTVVARIDGRPL